MKVAPTVEMKASDNPALENVEPDPTIFCTAFKKNRFYLVSWCFFFFSICCFLLDLIITWDSSHSFRNENQKTQRVPTRTETYLTRNPQRRKWWRPRRPRGPREYLTVPSSTPPWETFISSFSPSSKSKQARTMTLCSVLNLTNWHKLISMSASQMPQDCRELLCPQQEQLLQRPHIPQSHQGKILRFEV